MLPNFLVQVPRVRVCQRLTIFGDHIKNEYGLKNEDDLNNEDKLKFQPSSAGGTCSPPATPYPLQRRTPCIAAPPATENDKIEIKH